MGKNYDLSIIELGLKERVFYFWDVISLFYNECDFSSPNQQTEKGLWYNNYDWALTRFPAIPMETRRQVVKILFTLCEEDLGLWGEFYDRIYCTLRTLLGKEEVYIEGKNYSYYNRYVCSFEDLISPVTVVKEFLMWHRMGLPVSSVEKTLLQECLQKFLPDVSVDDKQFATLLAQKKADLQRRQRSLSLRYNYLGRLHDTLADDDKKNRLRVANERTTVNNGKSAIMEQLALAEAYPILTADFAVHEVRLEE